MDRFVVTSPDELLAALPHVLGFQPTESVVTVPLRAGMLIARVDIPHTAEEQRHAIGGVSQAYARHARPGEAVAVVCFTDDKQAAQRTSGAVAASLERVGVAVPIRLWATDLRWTDLDSGHSGVRTSSQATRIAAEATFAGHTAPLASRQELADSLIGDHAPLTAVLPEVRLAAESSDVRIEHAWALERAEQFHRDGIGLDDRDAARMLLALQHTPTRDALWTDMSRDNAATHVTLWTDLTRRAPDEVRTPAATMLAFSAWLNGDGAKAWCALDQIPPDSPPCPMAAILETALRNAASPAAWEEARATAAAEGGTGSLGRAGVKPGREVPGQTPAPTRQPPAV